MAIKAADREAQQGHASVDSLIEAARLATEAGTKLKRHIGALEKERGEKVAAVVKLKATLAAEEKTLKAKVNAELRTKLTAAQEAHRRTSTLLDELLARLARCKDVLA